MNTIVVLIALVSFISIGFAYVCTFIAGLPFFTMTKEEHAHYKKLKQQ